MHPDQEKLFVPQHGSVPDCWSSSFLTKQNTVAGVCPRGLQSSMAAGYPAMCHGTVSPQEGVDQQALRKGRIEHSVTSSLLFWVAVCKEQSSGFQESPGGDF